MILKGRTCENCKYFAKHYVITNSGRLQHPYGMGHCINDDMKKRTSRKIVFDALNCEMWEPEELQNKERRQNIIEALHTMQKRLEEIAMILKEG